ncbi:MAG: hypothetical protein EHM19_10410 [Candidatus Latescibacterota bacterium]|nr:MAG: hypothetical protein EHM19_10410 [Candidatus Latescibacterota bacterium]
MSDGPGNDGPAGNRPTSPATSEVSAHRGKRAAAFGIDWVLAFALGSIPFLGWFLGAGYMVFRDGFSSGLLDRRSLGKKIMRLRPVAIGGAPVTFRVSFRRNGILAAPLVLLALPLVGTYLASLSSLLIVTAEAGLALTGADGRRFGDRRAGTIVVESFD